MNSCCTYYFLDILLFDNSVHFSPQKRSQRLGGGAWRRPAVRVLPTYGLSLSARCPLSSVRLPGRRRSRLGRLGAAGDGLALSLCKAQGPVALKAVTLCSVGGPWLLAQLAAPVTDVRARFTWALRFCFRAAPAAAGGGSSRPRWVVQTLLRWGRGGPSSLCPFVLSWWPQFLSPIETRRAAFGATLLSGFSSHARWFVWKPNGGSRGPRSRPRGP